MMTATLFYVGEDDPPAKREILRAAMKLFSERGLAATSIRDIAEEGGYTNPALYKHFDSKEDLALHLFEICHRHLWARLNASIASEKSFDEKLEAYIGQWLEFVDENPEVVAFLSDSARVLWPKASAAVRKQSMIGLARSLVRESPKHGRGATALNADIAAASLQGTLGELARMIQVGVLEGPAVKWKASLTALFRSLVA
jgi:AcrR family transcriptional regulator